MKILLFDIDGTLLLSGGAGRRGMEKAFEDTFEVPAALDGLTLSGMTDPLIFKNACVKHNLPYSDEKHEAFKTAYLENLPKEILKPGSNKIAMPGVHELISKLSSMDGIQLGLLTGNYRKGAEIKLDHFNLNHYFGFGAFGDDNMDRNKLLPYAIERFKKMNGNSSNENEVWVIGDTPKDIECARPHDAIAVAVATGEYSSEHLAEAKPDFLFNDLSNMDDFLDIIGEDNED